MKLQPGMNLIDETIWVKTKKACSRLQAQITSGLVNDRGRYVDWFLKELKGDTLPPVNALDLEEIDIVAAQAPHKTLKLLLDQAERGGIKAVLQKALAGKRG